MMLPSVLGKGAVFGFSNTPTVLDCLETTLLSFYSLFEHSSGLSFVLHYTASLTVAHAIRLAIVALPARVVYYACFYTGARLAFNLWIAGRPCFRFYDLFISHTMRAFQRFFHRRQTSFRITSITNNPSVQFDEPTVHNDRP
jgi:hypothetical protein